jgi:23S rRNA pseudouridine1911/1915/1917 synthase
MNERPGTHPSNGKAPSARAEKTAVRFAAPRRDRLDRLVTEAMPALSRTQAQRLIEQGYVTVDGGEAVRAALTVEAETAIEVVVPQAQVPEGAAAAPLVVLYEDEHVLVIDKPAGLIVHAVTGSPDAMRGAAGRGLSLVDVVRAHYPEAEDLQDGDYRAGVVHRLDRDTSGVLAFAKTDVARDTLKDQWRAREVLKEYVALVEGRLDPPAGIIDAALGVDPNDPRRRAVVESGESAYTEYRVREQYGDEAALLDVTIRTGRTHQIRVHLEAVGHPVLGDRLYGRPSPLLARQALHAMRLGFRLPSTDEWREFEAPLPADMQDAIDRLRERHGVAAARSRHAGKPPTPALPHTGGGGGSEQ